MSFFEFPNTRTYDNDLGWLIKKVKEILDTVAQQNDKIAAVEQLAKELKTFVENYFDNLDVQQEINNKIDRMAADGTLLSILEDPTADVVSAWLKEHITQPATTVIDSSLTVAGAAADAKATGDNIFAMRVADYPVKIPTNFMANSFWSVEAAVVSRNSYTGYYQSSDPIAVSAGEKYKIQLKVGSSSRQYGIVVVDSGYTALLTVGRGSNIYIERTITIPENGAYLLLTTINEDVNAVIVQKLITAREHPSGLEKFNGLSFSVMGDSFSAFAGHVPTGYDVYYAGNNAGVYSYDQMWFNILANRLGMTPLVINAVSGSLVTKGIRTDRLESSSEERCAGLGTSPDIIFIAMGLNDYTYSAPMGDWNGRTNPGDDAVYTFRNAYATMLERIRINYPNALTIVITPFYAGRGINIGPNLVNGIPLCEKDYVDAVIDICNIMNVPYIDGFTIGFNKVNYYPKFCSDNASTPTHPNAAGQLAIADSVIDEIAFKCSGFINTLS